MEVVHGRSGVAVRMTLQPVQQVQKWDDRDIPGRFRRSEVRFLEIDAEPVHLDRDQGFEQKFMLDVVENLGRNIGVAEPLDLGPTDLLAFFWGSGSAAWHVLKQKNQSEVELFKAHAIASDAAASFTFR